MGLDVTQPQQPTPGQTDPDQAEQVDLTLVAAAFAAALAALLLHWVAVKATWITTIKTQVAALLRDEGVIGLNAVSVDTKHATDVVQEALIDYAHTAAQHVVAEAAAQGVHIAPATLTEADLGQQADVAVDLLAKSLVTSAVSEAVRVHPSETAVKEQAREEATAATEPDKEPTETAVKAAEEHVREEAAKDTASKVEKHLHTLTDAQVQYILGAVLHGAQNEARIATLLDASSEGYEVDLFSSEILDTHICAPCAEINGRRLARVSTGDFALLRATYPVRGYINCLGRDRCRGTVVGVWVKTS